MSLDLDFLTFRSFPRDNRRTSPSLCCDHCRGRLGFRVHRYWRMRFCSSACMHAYQQRLSPQTQQKILQLDVRRRRMGA
jgi:hypothetical protein